MAEDSQNTFTFLEDIDSIENNNKDNQKELKVENKEYKDFVEGLPEWDLVPPYEIIRRVNRK